MTILHRVQTGQAAETRMTVHREVRRDAGDRPKAAPEPPLASHFVLP
jgi:hypothetical protein